MPHYTSYLFYTVYSVAYTVYRAVRKKVNCVEQIVYSAEEHGVCFCCRLFTQREFTVRDFGLIEGDRRRERTAEGFVPVVSICQPVASHTHTHTCTHAHTHTPGKSVFRDFLSNHPYVSLTLCR